jgi:iron complex outermembrane receptor protein
MRYCELVARFLYCGFCVAAIAAASAVAASLPGAGEIQVAETSTASILAEMTLEELADIKVFSASRHLEPTRGVASAIFVLTGEDLRRSGVTSVPDALRLVPGVQVGRVDANKWAVSMRGFNSREANKLLVLVDGRSIYDPLFSGMLWESQDFLLEDIERIEVIRGPGGTLWGANAFNGVINIITRHTDATNGSFASLAIGDEERYIAALRHGWAIGDRQDARLYLKARERDEGYSASTVPFDASRDMRGGFRWDWASGSGDSVSVSGDIFDATAGIREDPILAHKVKHGGHNVLTRWARQTSEESNWRLQFYYDYVDYDSIGFIQERKTYDLEFQQSLQAGSRNLVVWGLGYRRMRDHALSRLAGLVDVLPEHRDDAIETIFVQDTIALVPDTLKLIVGIKFEDTGYAPSQWLPNLRLSFTPRPERTWWAAVSEATRVPSRLEADLTFFNVIRIGDEVGAEEVLAYEAGYRQLVSPTLWFDLAVFHNDYDNLLTREADGSLRNFMHGHTQGVELASRWEPMPRVRFDGSYTYLDMNLRIEPQSTGSSFLDVLHEGLVSRHQLALRAMIGLTQDIDLDATARYVDELEALDIPGYTQLDLTLRWRAGEYWEFSLVGSNLLDAHQPEQGFPLSGGLASEVERSVYVRAAWRR